MSIETELNDSLSSPTSIDSKLNYYSNRPFRRNTLESTSTADSFASSSGSTQDEYSDTHSAITRVKSYEEVVGFDSNNVGRDRGSYNSIYTASNFESNGSSRVSSGEDNTRSSFSSSNKGKGRAIEGCEVPVEEAEEEENEMVNESIEDEIGNRTNTDDSGKGKEVRINAINETTSTLANEIIPPLPLLSPSPIPSPQTLSESVPSSPLSPNFSSSGTLRNRIKKSLSFPGLRQNLNRTSSSSSLASSRHTVTNGIDSRLVTPLNSPAVSTTSSKGSWRMRSKEKLSKAFKRAGTPLSPFSPSLQPAPPFLSTQPKDPGFPFPLVSDSHSMEFQTAPSTPVGETEVVDIEMKSEEEEKRDLFNEMLPREVKIRILRELLNGMEEGDEEWSGEVAGRRELIRAGRVSKTWLSLSLDGSLWSDIDVNSSFNPDTIGVQGLLRLLEHAGSFVKRLNLKGFSRLTGEDLSRGVKSIIDSEGRTTLGLTTLDMTGCSLLSSHSLSDVFMVSPHLTSVTLFALTCVNGLNLRILGSVASSLRYLNVSRCSSLDIGSIYFLPTTLEHLFMSGSVSLQDHILIRLAHRFVQVKTLDVSYSPLITDKAFELIVTPSTLSTIPTSTKSNLNRFPSLSITSSYNRQNPPSSIKSLLPWTHLNISGCKLITSTTFTHLSHCLPSLEILEVSRTGRRLSNGINSLSSFLKTVPLLRKLDLENGLLLSDEVLLSLIPDARRKGGEGCKYLEYIIITTCTSFTDAGIAALIRGCEQLKVLEADGTNMGEETAKEFVLALKRKEEPGTMLSILDTRLIGEGLYKTLLERGGPAYRPRRGRRGYRYQEFGYHHPRQSMLVDERVEVEAVGGLRELDEELVVIRSMKGHEEVDRADKFKREEKIAKEKRRGGEEKKEGWEEMVSRCTIS